MEKQKNIPKLRFPEFKEEWIKKKLGEVSDISKLAGFEYSKHIVYSDVGSIIALRALNIKNNQLLLDDVKYIDDSDFSKLGRSKLYIGDLMFTYIGANIGDVALINENDRYYLAPNVARIRSNKEYLNYYFILQYFNIPKFLKQEIHGFIASSSQPALSMESIRKFNIKVPTLPEQTKIASFLTAVDDKINALKKKKSLLEKYKKGVMQQIFTQELRFKDDNGNDFKAWEEKKLGEVCIEHQLKNKNKETKEVFSVAKHKGVINQIEHLGRSFSAKEILHYKLIYPGDLVYTKSPTSDFPFGIIKQNRTGRLGVVSPLYCVFKPKTYALGYLLHEYFISSINTYNYLSPLVQKGAKNTMNINNYDFLNGASFLLPMDEAEQNKIANFLSAIDDKINAVQQQIEKTEVWKKGLLQKMFV